MLNRALLEEKLKKSGYWLPFAASKQKILDVERKRLAVIAAIITLCCAQGLFAQSFVFSVRPEFVAITGAAVGGDTSTSKKLLYGKPISEGIIRGGWAVESGWAGKYTKDTTGGFFITVSVHGNFDGTEDIGAFLNLGGLSVGGGSGGGGGVSLGFRRVPYHINVIKDGVHYDRYTDYNYIIGGAFFKMLFGKTHNIDITPKVLLGFRESKYAIKDGNSFRYYYDDNASESLNGLILVFSLGIGYTLTTNR